jgi:hypothetical protein
MAAKVRDVRFFCNLSPGLRRFGQMVEIDDRSDGIPAIVSQWRRVGQAISAQC